MSEPPDPQPSAPPKRPRSPRGQSGSGTKKTTATLPRPAPDDREEWKKYWTTQGQPWRTEPEIDEEQQKYLAARRAIQPDIEQGIYPVKDIKLNRADVEWLLATHENGRGPVDWNIEGQKGRRGIDVRGADLRQANLYGLPLACMNGGLTNEEWLEATEEQREMAAVHLEGAHLDRASLERANLVGAHLEGAGLSGAHLEGDDFFNGAVLSYAHLEWANLIRANLRRATLFMAHLEGADLISARCEEANLNGAHLEGANLLNANLQGTRLRNAHLNSKDVSPTDLERVRKWRPSWRTQDFPATLPSTNLWLVSFDAATQLDGIVLGDEKLGWVSLADIRWGGANLAVVDWTALKVLGDEQKARKLKGRQLRGYRTAVRAYRQLASVLHDQGLSEEADRFVYRAQLLQRVILRRQRKFLKYLGSWLLWLIAGYGYRPLRSLLLYLILICGFATAYFFLGPTVGVPLSPLGAIVFSITSFHGRGFFPGGSPGHSITLDDPLTVVAASEAVLGLLIEISFIATFTQRFFSR